MGNCFYKTSVSKLPKFIYPDEYHLLNVEKIHPKQLKYDNLRILFRNHNSYLYLKYNTKEIIKLYTPGYQICLETEIKILKNISHTHIVSLRSYTPF